MSKIDSKTGCPRCLGSEAYVAYHNEERGAPAHDERTLFEPLILEGARR